MSEDMKGTGVSMTHARFSTRVGAIVSALGIAAVLLTGCSTPDVVASPSPASSEAPRNGPEPVLQPDGTAEDNLPYFDTVNAQTLVGNPEADGRAFVDGLVAAGFDKTTMEVTPDSTTIGNAADSIQFSVRWGESCLIGQSGTAVNGYQSTVGKVLGTGTCLIGKTRTIDW